MMDINSLLEGEQVSLLRARFATQTVAKERFLACAVGFSERIRQSVYPHGQLAHALLT